jgi:hypothetical protein
MTTIEAVRVLALTLYEGPSWVTGSRSAWDGLISPFPVPLTGRPVVPTGLVGVVAPEWGKGRIRDGQVIAATNRSASDW